MAVEGYDNNGSASNNDDNNASWCKCHHKHYFHLSQNFICNDAVVYIKYLSFEAYIRLYIRMYIHEYLAAPTVNQSNCNAICISISAIRIYACIYAYAVCMR